MRIIREQTAAIVVDYQERIVPAMADWEETRKNSEKLLKGLALLEVPMVVTQQYTKGLGETIPEIRAAVGSDAYVEKIAFSSYEEPAVQQAVAGREFVIICGIEAHICVLQTVIDVSAAGQVPVLVTDCVTSRRSADKRIALKRAREEGAVLTTYESLLFELLRKAGTPVSKEIQRLIK